MIMRPMDGKSQTGVILLRKAEKLARVGEVLEGDTSLLSDC
jgi:hypothetical protein